MRFCISDADLIELVQAGADHRRSLRLPDGHRVGQGRRHRQDLRAAGAARDGPEPCRPHDPALHAAAEGTGARDGPQHRPAHRRRPGPRHPRHPRDGTRRNRRRARRRHDRPGLGAGDEARVGDRHEPWRPHVPRRDHRPRTGHPRCRRLRRRDEENQGRPARHRLVRRRRHGLHLRRPARSSASRRSNSTRCPACPSRS